MQKFTLSTLALATLVAGCGGAPSSNELRLDNDGNGFFSGTAGNAWTPAEIILQACGPNQAASDFRTVASDAGSGAFAFGGRCSGGTNATVPSPQRSASVVAAPTSQAASNGGSTYVSPYSTGYTPPSGFYQN